MMFRRLLQSKAILVKVGAAAMALSVLALALSKFFVSESPIERKSLNQVEAVLADYSRALSTGHITQEDLYTPMMRDLIRERRHFYEEYFEVALHSTLESITSEFVFEPDSIDAVAAILSGQLKIEPDARVSVLPVDRLSLQVTEKVTLRGRYQVSPEEYPMVQAARWALARTDDETVKQELKEYIRLAVEDMSESSEEGFESVFVLRHSLVMVKSQSGIQIARDSFTSRSIDDSGTDSVVWRDGEYIRNKPDLTEWPDHKMYTMPIEEMGRKMLNLYTDMYTDENSTLEFDD